MDHEFTNVLIHSVLHTFGYEDDTPNKKQKMFKLQKEYLNEIDYKGIFKKKDDN